MTQNISSQSSPISRTPKLHVAQAAGLLNSQAELISTPETVICLHRGHSTSSHLLLPSITSQIHFLHPNPVSGSAFRGNQTEDSMNVLLMRVIRIVRLTFYLFFYFLAAPQCMPDLSSPNRDRTCTPCSGSLEFLTTGPAGKSSGLHFKISLQLVSRA